MDRGGVFTWELDQRMWPALDDELGQYHVFPVIMNAAQPQLVMPLAPAQVPPPNINADEERLGQLLAVASAVGLPRQLEREDTSTVTRLPLFVAEGFVPTLGLVDTPGGSEPTFATALDEHVAGPAK